MSMSDTDASDAICFSENYYRSLHFGQNIVYDFRNTRGISKCENHISLMHRKLALKIT